MSIPELAEQVDPILDIAVLEGQMLADFFLGGFLSVPVRSLTLYSNVLCGTP